MTGAARCYHRDLGMNREQQPVRRSFLAGAVAALAGTARAARASKMKFGLTSYQWGADWDIPTMIANCTKAKALGVELRTSAKYKHGSRSTSARTGAAK